MSVKNLQDEVLRFIEQEKAVFLSDIARKFNISNLTSRDIVGFLEKQNLVLVTDKGIAKLVTPREGDSDG
jgi:Mn-dependent DtxR family transcriptional regulator